MTDRNAHSPRKVAIPDHLWDLFEDMAQKMGTERDGLVWLAPRPPRAPHSADACSVR